MTRIIAWVLLASIAPEAMADFHEAMTLYQAKDYPHAFTEFHRLAEIGDHSAQFNVGVMYYRGQSVDKDSIQAYAWMALATQDEDAGWKRARDEVYAGLPAEARARADAAKEDLFDRYSDQALAKQLAPVLTFADTDVQTARVTQRVAPEYPGNMELREASGTVELFYAIAPDGTTRLHGVHLATNADFAQAAIDAVKRWRYEPARLDGRPVEQYGIRIQFIFKMAEAEFDQGKMTRTINDLHEKAENGGANEAYKYASTLEILSSVTKIPQSAGNPNEWYWKAAARGHTLAQFSLGNNLLYGSQCTPDPFKGVQWLQRAAEAGQPDAQYVLAIEMLSGGRLAPQREAALKWLERAASNDFAAAKLKLAWLHATSPDERFRNAEIASRYLKAMPEKFIDRLSLLEVGAAVAAASGKFRDAEKLQMEAIGEAKHYGLPTEALLTKARAYEQGKMWVEAPGGL